MGTTKRVIPQPQYKHLWVEMFILPFFLQIIYVGPHIGPPFLYIYL